MRKHTLPLFLLILTFTILGLTAYQSSASPLTDETPIKLFLPLIRKAAVPVWIGPDGGSVVCVVIDPVNPKVVYVGTWGAGVFKSTNGGDSWTPVNTGLGNLYINSLAIDPRNPLVLYAGTYRSKVFKTTNGGNSWFSASDGIQDQAIVYTIAIDPRWTEHLFIGTRGVSDEGTEPWSGIIYLSKDGGASWQLSEDNVGSALLQDWAYSLAFDPTNSNTVFAAFHEKGFGRTFDGGYSWGYVPGDYLVDESGRALLVDHQDPDTLYYGSWHGGGVYRSEDQGDTWVKKSPLYLSPKIYSLAMDPQQARTVYMVSFSDGIYKTVDRGENWAYSGLKTQLPYSLAVDPSNSQVLYAGVAGSGLFKSVSGGGSWAHAQAGLRNSAVTGLIVSQDDPGLLAAGTLGGGVSQSPDGGLSWQDYNTGLPEQAVTALSERPDQPGKLFALTASSGVFTRTLGVDAAWIPASTGLPLAPVVVKPEPSAWDALVNPLEVSLTSAEPLVRLLSITFAAQNPKYVYLGTDGMGIYRSANGGLGWTAKGLVGWQVRSVAVDLGNVDAWYAATNRVGGIYATSNGGGSYSLIELPERVFNALVISPASPGVVFAGTDSGVYRLENGAWSLAGLEGKNVLALAVHPALPGQIYAGTDAGAYFSWDGGRIWNPGVGQLSTVTIQGFGFDPVRSNRVYFNTNTQGSVRYDFEPSD